MEETKEVWTVQFLYKTSWFKPAVWVLDSIHGTGTSALSRIEDKKAEEDSTCKKYKFDAVEVENHD